MNKSKAITCSIYPIWRIRNHSYQFTSVSYDLGYRPKLGMGSDIKNPDFNMNIFATLQNDYNVPFDIALIICNEYMGFNMLSNFTLIGEWNTKIPSTYFNEMIESMKNCE